MQRPVETPFSEKELFDRIATGDEKAFRVLFERYKTKLYYFILHFVKSEAAAEEMVQETFLRIWTNRYALDRIEDPGSYLFIAAKNRSLNHIRRTILEREFQASLREDSLADNATEEQLLFNESRRLIQAAVARLSPQQQQVYQLAREEGLTREEVASLMGIAPNTVKNHLAAAVRSIRDYLLQNDAMLVLLLFLGGML